MVLTARVPRRALAAAVLALIAGPLGAAEPACPGGALRADYGIRYRFTAGDFVDEPGEPRWVHFLTEPTIVEVLPHGPAAGALAPGDAIASVDGLLITTRAGSRRFAVSAPDGVSLGVRRGGATTEVRIEPARECVEVTPRESVPSADVGRPRSRFGFRLRCTGCGLDPATDRWRFRGPLAVTALARPGPAADAGLRPGDELLEIDGVALASPQGAARFFGAVPGQTVALTVRRDGRLRVVQVVAAEPEAGPP